MIEQKSVSLEDARRVIAAGEAKAGEIASPSNAALYIRLSGEPKRLVRSGGAASGIFLMTLTPAPRSDISEELREQRSRLV